MTEWNLPVCERTLLFSAPHTPTVAVESTQAVLGAEIVYH
jgi:hypothetical protein